MGIALQARHPNYNLFPCSPCDPWIILVAYGKKSLGEIFFKEWPEARNYSSSITYKH